MTEPAPRKSDLGVRVVSAVVMVAVAGAALWLGGRAFTAFVAVIALAVLWEWWGLATKLTSSATALGVWMVAGLIYIGLAAYTLNGVRQVGFILTLHVLLLVIAVDVGAYVFGRTFGGPKIAPKISPSKTWAGLVGGILAASLTNAAITPWQEPNIRPGDWPAIMGNSLLICTIVAVIAQAGDFFESWMKRRAGVKDSGTLIPGHGGFFDRTDGLIAVLFVAAAHSGIVSMVELVLTHAEVVDLGRS